MTTWNPVITLGSGFEYSIRGSEECGFRITAMGRKNPNVFETLEEAHKALKVIFRHYMQGRKE